MAQRKTGVIIVSQGMLLTIGEVGHIRQEILIEFVRAQKVALISHITTVGAHDRINPSLLHDVAHFKDVAARRNDWQDVIGF